MGGQAPWLALGQRPVRAQLRKEPLAPGSAETARLPRAFLVCHVRLGVHPHPPPPLSKPHVSWYEAPHKANLVLRECREVEPVGPPLMASDQQAEQSCSGGSVEGGASSGASIT